MEVEQLTAKANLIRESLVKSQTMTDKMVSILGSFDERLSALETAMRPTQIRTHAFRKAYKNIENTLKSAQFVLGQFDVSRQVEARLAEGPRGDLPSYLAAIDQLQGAVEFFGNNRNFKSSEAALAHGRGLLQKALGRLEEEFRTVLLNSSKNVDPAKLVEALPEPVPPKADGAGATPEKPAVLPVLMEASALPVLHDMAVRLVSGGHGQQCSRVYRDVREKSLLQSLGRLGAEKLSKEDVQKLPWEMLESKIGSWIQYVRIAVKLLFAAERALCNRVLYKLEILPRTFQSLTDPGMNMLLSFGEAIARSKKSPEKLFVLLDMYETMRDLSDDIDLIFAEPECSELREAAHGLQQRLAQTARETFAEFEEAVERDATKTPVADGTVHPLTSYVINYIKFLFDYQRTLKELFHDEEVAAAAAADKGGSASASAFTHLGEATKRIMQVLQANLEGKSKLYKDPALTQLFMMNNIHYMVRSVRRSEAKDLLGDDWVQRHRRVVQQHATAYQRAAWGKVLQYLSGTGLAGTGMTGAVGTATDAGGASKVLLKERFKNFNLAFEELHAKQSQWSIPDVELRDAVRLAVAEVLMPAYRSFLRRYSQVLESGKNPGKYIKYTPEDLDRMLGEFFESKTKGWSETKSR